MIEFTDIRIRAALPLHPYLAEHPCLSLRLIADGNICGETHGVNGDLVTGTWTFNSSLSAPAVKQSLTIAVTTGPKNAWIQVGSVTVKMAELLERLKDQANSCQEFDIFDSSAPLQLKLFMTCSTKSPSILDRPPQAVGNRDHTDDKHRQNTQAHFEPKDVDLSSRRDLESLYAKTIRLPDQDDYKAHTLSLLGGAYHELYKKERGSADLERAVSLHDDAMQLTGPVHPQLASRAHHLSTALVDRFQQNRDPVDIARAISYCNTALKFTEDSNGDRTSLLRLLGTACLLRFERLGDLEDVENSIMCRKQVVELTPDGHHDMPGRLCDLGTALQRRFERLGCLTDLEDAILNLRKAVKLTPDGHPRNPVVFSSLGAALISRSKRLGSLVDMEDMISNMQKAIELTPDGHPDKPGRFNNLGIALKSRFERLGSLADVEDAIWNMQRAVELTPTGHPDKPRWLNNLGNALQLRFDRLGSLADMEAAIWNKRQAVELTPDGHPDKPRRTNNLGIALQSRFDRLGSLTDIDDAISNKQKAVEMTPDGHPEKPRWLTNLGNALQSRFQRLGAPADIEDAIWNMQKAVKLTPDDHPDKAGLISNLASARQSRFARLGNFEDGTSDLQNAVELMPDGHPNKSTLLTNLGGGFLNRFKRLGVPSDLESALSAFSAAAQSTSSLAMVRFNAARRWAKVAEEHSRSPLEAFSCAIDLLPRIAWVGLAVTDQHALLADVGDIVHDAVAAAIRYEEYETAVVWAEQGRSIVWQNLLHLRNPVDDLRNTHPRLADQLQNIARQLEGSASHDALRKEGQAALEEDVSRGYSKLAIEWDNLIDEVRGLPNFGSFLKAKSFRELATAAHEGPVVILNVHDSQCNALVLIAEDSVERRAAVVNIPLERFSYEKSKKLFQALTDTLSSAGVRDRKTGRSQSQADGEAKFKRILNVLWQDVVKPVIEGLAFQPESKRPPRIWWCATGLLGFLPIHAAGLYDTEEIGEKASDYVVSSYTPTLTAILELSEPTMQDFQVLTVAQAAAPGASPIPKTEDEVRIVHRLTAGARSMSLMREDATVKRVREGMMESNWIHLACHGQQNPDDPMESGFLLHDSTLKLSEIVKMSLPKADFAFLSACQTAMGDEKVTEESVHLAAGMFLSGCRGVIATMWSIQDDDAPKIAEDVYSRIFKDGKPHRKEAAYALHEAVKRLRESGAQCTSWVPFIHIGR